MHVRTIALQYPRPGIVGEKQLEIRPQPRLQRLLLDRKAGFVSAKEIPVHPVGAGTVKFLFAVIAEVVDS